MSTHDKKLPIQLFNKIGSSLLRDRPMSIPDQWGHVEPDDTGVICDLIEPHLHRCNWLSLKTIDEHQGCNMLGYLLSRLLPILLSIRLHFENHRLPPPAQMMEHGAPSLTHVYLSGKPNIYCSLPLRNVTTLRLEFNGNS